MNKLKASGPTPSEPAQQPKGANSESIVVVMVATRGSSKAASLSKAEGKKKMVVEKTIEKQPTAETIVVESSQCIDLKTGDEHCHSGVIRYHPPKPTLRPALTWGATMDAAHLVLERTGAKSSRGKKASDFTDPRDQFECVTRPDRQTLNLCTRDPFGTETYFKCKPTTELHKLFSAYAMRSDIPAEELAFLYHGTHLMGQHTPEDLGLRDGDRIDVAFLNMASPEVLGFINGQ